MSNRVGDRSTARRRPPKRAQLPDADAADSRVGGAGRMLMLRRVPVARTSAARRVVALAFATLLAAAAVAVAAEPPRWVRHVLGDASSAAAGARQPRGSAGGAAARLLGARRVDRSRRRHAATAGAVDGGDVVAAGLLHRGVARSRALGGRADGRVAWTLAAPADDPRRAWSPDGYRIAYRRADGLAVGRGRRHRSARACRVGPRRSRRRGARVSRTRSAWVGGARARRGARRRHRRGRSGGRRPQSGEFASCSGRPTAAASSPAASTASSSSTCAPTAFDRSTLPRTATVTSAAWAPRPAHSRWRCASAAPAASRSTLGHSRAPSRFAVDGTLTSLAWSPDASRLLVRWRRSPTSGYLLPHRRNTRIPAIAAISRRFGGSAGSRAGAGAAPFDAPRVGDPRRVNPK